MNGWTVRNCELRSVIIHSLKPDIISINETHLVGGDSIDLEGYVWFGNNRVKHTRPPKGWGGCLMKSYKPLFDEIVQSDCNV